MKFINDTNTIDFVINICISFLHGCELLLDSIAQGRTRGGGGGEGKGPLIGT